MTSVIFKASEAFGLGDVRSVRPVAGGLSNDMWRVDTRGSAFAVKVMQVNAERADFRDNIEAAFVIEMNAFQQGVPCPEPCPNPDGGGLLRVEGHWVRVHRWCDGRPPIATNHLDEAGRLLSRIHQVAPQHDGTLDDEPWDVEGWASLAAQPGLPDELASRIRSAAHDLAALEAATAAAPGFATAHVPSHGDLDPKNTLCAGDQMLAVDWDAASSQPVTREAVSLALDWSADVEGFRRVVTAYSEASGAAIPPGAWVFGGWVSALGGWLVYNASERADSELGQREVSQACDRLQALYRSLEAYDAALS